MQITLAKYFDATHVTAKLKPTLVSKINTAVQLATISASLAAPIYEFVGNNIRKKSHLTKFIEIKYANLLINNN